tara:strand:- start:1350 stop:3821 length:2472 start_codon:yes stop_codon:yes gene_type:complete
MSLLEEGKANTHLTHLEELVLTQGPKGYQMARAFLRQLLETLKGNSRSHVQTSVKWDGAPAIFAGINPENGRFFVGTKSIFNKVPKINYTPQDIIDNHSKAEKDDDGNYVPDEEGNVDHGGLVDKLLRAFKELPKLGIKNILQGDFMFDDGMLDVVEIDGEPHYRFKPNTIIYAVPVDSELGKEVGKSKFGIVFHTTYDSLDSGASFGADVSQLNRVPGIWFDDAFFTDDTGTVTLTENEERRVISLVKQADAVNEKINYHDLPLAELNMYINSEIRIGEFLEDPVRSFKEFLKWYSVKLEGRVDSLKREDNKLKAFEAGEKELQSFKNNEKSFLNLFKVSRLLFEAKNIFIIKYNNAVYNTKHFIDDGSGDLIATNPEGYVAVDHAGNGVKFVDRLEFSRANFLVDKSAKFKQNESLTVYWGTDGFSTTKTLTEWASNLPASTRNNKVLYEKLRAGVSITSLVKEAKNVKQSLAAAVNWGLIQETWAQLDPRWRDDYGKNPDPARELGSYAPHGRSKGKSSETVLYLPGGFKPPHKGHLALAQDALDKNPGSKLIIMSGEDPRDGITLDQARKVWEIYFSAIGKPGDVEVRALKPEFQLDDDGNRMQKFVMGAGVKYNKKWDDAPEAAKGVRTVDKVIDPETGEPMMVDYQTQSPINSIGNAVRFTDKPGRAKIVKIVASEADPGNAVAIAEYLQGLGFNAKPEIVPVRVKDEGGTGKMSARHMRQAISKGFDAFKPFLPEKILKEFPKKAEEIFTMLGGTIEEMSSGGGSVGSGALQGAPGNGLMSRRASKRGKKRQEQKFRHGEELVTEVIDYLLGITVG